MSCGPTGHVLRWNRTCFEVEQDMFWGGTVHVLRSYRTCPEVVQDMSWGRAVVASFVYVVILEVLVLLFIYGKHPETYSTRVSALSVTVRFLFYICMIMVGSSTAYLSRIRLRSTFWKISRECGLYEACIVLIIPALIGACARTPIVI